MSAADFFLCGMAIGMLLVLVLWEFTEWKKGS